MSAQAKAAVPHNRKNKVHRSRGDVIFDTVNIIIITLFLIIIIYPLYWTLIASFSEPNAVNRGDVTLWPVGITFSGYTRLFEYSTIWRSYVNTLIYTVVGTVLNVAVTVAGGYALSRQSLPGRSIIMKLLVFTMFFNGGMVPLYMLVKDLNLLNNMWGLILPTTLSVYNMTIARAFFQGSIPDGIVEAAQIDGCSNIGTFFRIVLPVSPAIISVMCLFHVVFRWNEYFNAMMFFTKPELYPLQLVLRDILINNTMTQVQASGSDAQAIEEMRRQAQLIKYSSIVVSTVPMLILYPFLQKYFVKGIMVGSLKG